MDMAGGNFNGAAAANFGGFDLLSWYVHIISFRNMAISDIYSMDKFVCHDHDPLSLSLQNQFF